MNNTSEVTKRIRDIEEELLMNEKNMVNQCHEIIKTETLISQYQQTLKSQTELLKEYIVNKEKLEKDKMTLLNVLEEQEKSRELEIQRNIEMDSCQKTTKSKLQLFPDSYQITRSTKSLKYYRAITEHLSKVSPQCKVHYPNQMAIPNNLKSLTSERSMLLYHIVNVGEYPLADIIDQAIIMPVDLHVSQGTGELISIRGTEPDIQYHMTTLISSKSYSIGQFQTTATRFVLLVHTVPMSIAIDIVNDTQLPMATINDLPEPVGYSIVSNSKKNNDSFIKRILSFTDIRNRVLFVDAHFSETVHGSLVPIELSVIDYHGKVHINTLMCPRQQIKNYRQEKHGYCEKHLLGSPDSEEIMKYFYTVIWDRILIGHNLKNKIRDLKIDLKFVCGIKDLQSNFVFNSDKSVFSLKEISQRILSNESSSSSQSLQSGLSTAKRNTETMRKIYLFMESKWQSSVARKEDQNDVSDMWHNNNNVHSNKVDKQFNNTDLII